VSARRSVLLLGLDAADADIVDALMAAGRLPTLSRLREQGLWGPLDSPAGLYAGGGWPTYSTGRAIASHGLYHDKLWRAERMRVEVASPDWLPVRPFWEALPDLRVCIVDVPMVLGPPRPVNGQYLAGWGTHDRVGRGSWPQHLWRWCERRHGRPVMPPEHFGRQTPRSLGALPRALVDATRQLGAVAADLLRRDDWDLACIVFGATHRAGHYLWDRAGAGPGRGLVDVYEAVDDAVASVLACAGDDTLVVAFALHGMDANPGWSDLLPAILTRLAQQRWGTSPRSGLLYRARRAVPFHWARPLLKRLPDRARHALVRVWSRRMFDWKTTRFFPLPMDHAGYLRINLRGREAAGVVEPGAEYDALCAELSELLSSLRDADTGEPIVRDVVRAWADAPDGAPGRALLPDLVVRWAGPTAGATRKLASTMLPGFSYDVPPDLPSGRSGNHTDRAWFIARGPGVPAGGRAAGEHHIVDLVPTALHHLGVPAPPEFEGTAIDLTHAAPDAAVSRDRKSTRL